MLALKKNIVVNVYVEAYKPSSRKKFYLPIEKLFIKKLVDSRDFLTTFKHYMTIVTAKFYLILITDLIGYLGLNKMQF